MSPIGHRLSNLTAVNEAQRWAQFAEYLAEQRQRLGLNRREAAKRAKVPEAVWRDLENGSRKGYGGVRVLPHPSREVLEQMAGALELDPDELIGHVPRPARSKSASGRKAPADEVTLLARRITRLSSRDRRLVEHMIDSMLEES